jgi:putative transposase
MKGKKHSAEQIIKKLREAELMLSAGKTIGQVVQTLEISEQTFHRWRNQYGGMKAEEAKRLKELEDENKRLKKLLAEAELDKAILKEALEGNYSVLHKLRARRGVARRLRMCKHARASRSVGLAMCWVSRVPPSVTHRNPSARKKRGSCSGCTSWQQSIRAMGIG